MSHGSSSLEENIEHTHMIAARILGKRGKKVDMSYVNYERDIQKRYRVQIHKTWPAGVRFVKPSRITKLDEAQDLHDALEKGTTYWAKLTETELAELRERLQESDAPARSRSDKGGRHRKGKRAASGGETDSEDGNESDRGSKASARKRPRNDHMRAAKMLPPGSFKSAEFVEGSDEESENE